MGQKQGFLNLWKIWSLICSEFVLNLVWICSLRKIYIICCVPAQIPHLGKFLLLRNGPKCSQPVGLHDFLINQISRTNQWISMIICMLMQIHVIKKFEQIFFGWVWSKIGVARRSWDSKIDCISRINKWSELIFCMPVQIQES